MVSSHFFSADSEQRSSTAPKGQDDGAMRSAIPTEIASPPWLLDTLFRNLSYDLEQVADIIDPILTAQNHCYRTDWYVQGIVASDRAFLSTNINADRAIQVTLCGTRWLLGQSGRCAVAMAQPGIADCHAALNFDPLRGFFMTDLGSGGGTWVNGRRLAPAQRHYLQDGDLVKLGSLRFEFLQQRCDQSVWYDD
ncbi:FHA domain-containing protein [Nodosilinea sp. PGN35]|uniref:FHA domain-containing protein n=1 Tax=Nodosilinea sp. PGN35 TaxID=3020489 RepID=UPI0023B31C91|nr:FHA domain-containing protein [Nodosilinea sp. TSF1-S3]MDF0368934.1 FHA domain-containing protein [Nodosilinea sp. TSF1-S3]